MKLKTIVLITLLIPLVARAQDRTAKDSLQILKNVYNNIMKEPEGSLNPRVIRFGTPELDRLCTRYQITYTGPYFTNYLEDPKRSSSEFKDTKKQLVVTVFQSYYNDENTLRFIKELKKVPGVATARMSAFDYFHQHLLKSHHLFRGDCDLYSNDVIITFDPATYKKVKRNIQYDGSK